MSYYRIVRKPVADPTCLVERADRESYMREGDWMRKSFFGGQERKRRRRMIGHGEGGGIRTWA